MQIINNLSHANGRNIGVTLAYGKSITTTSFEFSAPVEDNPVDDKGSADRIALLSNSWLLVARPL